MKARPAPHRRCAEGPSVKTILADTLQRREVEVLSSKIVVPDAHCILNSLAEELSLGIHHPPLQVKNRPEKGNYGKEHLGAPKRRQALLHGVVLRNRIADVKDFCLANLLCRQSAQASEK